MNSSECGSHTYKREVAGHEVQRYVDGTVVRASLEASAPHPINP